MSDPTSFLRPLLDLVREAHRSGLEPSELSEAFFAALSAEQRSGLQHWIAELLTSVLKGRGLAEAPGAVLGHPGYASLLPSSSEEAGGSALHDLTQDLIEAIFGSRRLHSLVSSSENPAWNPDLMARRMTKNFVHDLQRRADPLGAAIYDGLKRAAGLEEAAGWVSWRDDRILLARRDASLALVREVAPEPSEIRLAFRAAGALEELRSKALRYFGGGEECDGEVRRVHLRSRQIDQQLLNGLDALRGVDAVTLKLSRLVEALRAELPDGRLGQVGGASELLLEVQAAPERQPASEEGGGLLLQLEAAIEAARMRPVVAQRLLRIARAMAQAVEDGADPQDALRQLGIPKQTLSDSMARLRELTARLAGGDSSPGIRG